MKQLRKRNNYTLSIEAQEIIDKVKNKSKFVSEAIIQKNGFDKLHEALTKFAKPTPKYPKGGVHPENGMAIVGEQGAELIKTESGYTITMPLVDCPHNEMTVVPRTELPCSDYVMACAKCGFRP